jgi:tRNA threonylcarbamoyladenosine biosynthesis protein TsaB
VEPPIRPLLALDTSTDRSAVALALAHGTVLEAPADASRRHGRGLVPAIRDLLQQAGITPSQVALIAVGLGPGSFTGLRIGLTMAKTMSYIRRIPLIGLDSLAVVARNAPPDAQKILVVADAQRGEVYSAEFQRGNEAGRLVRTRETTIEPMRQWRDRLCPGDFVIGPAIDRLACDWPEFVRLSDPQSGLPQGRKLIELANEVEKTGERLDPWYLEPVYLRRSAAEEKRAAAESTPSS